VESALSIRVKSVKEIFAIIKQRFLSIALALWGVIRNVTNLIVLLPKLKRKMEVCSFNIHIYIRELML